MGRYEDKDYGYFKDDKESKERLILDYLPLIRKIAGKLSVALPPAMDENDLIGSGIVGLLEASKRYDSSRGASFASFASLRIRGAMIDELRKISWAPRSFFSGLRKVQEAGDKLSQELKRDALPEEIAAELQWPVSEVTRVYAHCNFLTVVSLEKVLFSADDDEGLRLEDKVAAKDELPGDQLEKKEMELMLAEALKELGKRDQILLSLYYQEDLTQKEIAGLLNVSPVRVSQLHARALQQLRKVLQKSFLIDD